MAKTTILQVIPQLDTGGAERSTLEMVDALHRVGAVALVATEGGRLAEEVTRLGGELLTMPVASKNPWQMLKNAMAIRRLIEARGIGLVHARSRAPAWSGLLAARSRGIPFVTTYHGIYNEHGPIKRLYNSVMARGDLVIANSHFTANVVESRHGVSRQKIRVIHRGVDVSAFTRAAVTEERRAALRAAWGIESGQTIVLHPARLTTWKGQRVVIEAARRLKEAGAVRETVFVLAGDHQDRGDYLAALQRQIEQAGLTGVVRLVGHCSDMAAAYVLASAVLIASIEPEAFGRTSVEAQALGCPVVATDIGAPPETVMATPFVDADQITGWLVPPDDAGALATALSQLFACDEAKRTALARRAIDNVATRFSDTSLKTRTLAVYDELLGTRLLAAYEHAPLGERLTH